MPRRLQNISAILCCGRPSWLNDDIILRLWCAAYDTFTYAIWLSTVCIFLVTDSEVWLYCSKGFSCLGVVCELPHASFPNLWNELGNFVDFLNITKTVRHSFLHVLAMSFPYLVLSKETTILWVVLSLKIFGILNIRLQKLVASRKLFHTELSEWSLGLYDQCRITGVKELVYNERCICLQRLNTYEAWCIILLNQWSRRYYWRLWGSFLSILRSDGVVPYLRNVLTSFTFYIIIRLRMLSIHFRGCSVCSDSRKGGPPSRDDRPKKVFISFHCFLSDVNSLKLISLYKSLTSGPMCCK